MKLLPIILAVVFFKLTVLPSCEGSTCCSESTQLADSDVPSEDNDCTSYCMCLHCGYTTVIQEQSQFHDQTQDEIVSIIPMYSEIYNHLYVASLWHPPLMG